MLKSATTITLSEEQWQMAKGYINSNELTSVITIPLAKRLAINFGRYENQSVMCFSQLRPDSLYLVEKKGKIDSKSFTGYLVLFNDKGKAVVANRYVNGRYEGQYEVLPKRSLLKSDDVTYYGGEFDGYFCYGTIPLDKNYFLTFDVISFLNTQMNASSMMTEQLCDRDLYLTNPKTNLDPTPEKRTLTPEEEDKLNKALDEIRKRGCGASMAIGMVGSNWNGYTFAIDPSIKGAGYNPQSKNFVFKDADEINPQRLTEEIIHAAQDLLYPNGTYQYINLGNPNIEFEAKILVEISTYAKLGCCINAQLYFQNEDYLNFLNNIRSWAQNGMVDLNQYNYWLNKWFNTANNEYHKGSVNGSLTPELLNKLLKENSDCVKTSLL